MSVVGMKCEKCGGESFVCDSRTGGKIANAIYRRRECKKCGFKWATYEIDADTVKYMIINKNLANTLKGVQTTIDCALNQLNGGSE